jgi:hypothetical protein
VDGNGRPDHSWPTPLVATGFTASTRFSAASGTATATASAPSSAKAGPRGAAHRRIIAALLRKAATSFPHEAAACREKAEALRAKYGL